MLTSVCRFHIERYTIARRIQEPAATRMWDQPNKVDVTQNDSSFSYIVMISPNKISERDFLSSTDIFMQSIIVCISPIPVKQSWGIWWFQITCIHRNAKLWQGINKSWTEMRWLWLICVEYLSLLHSKIKLHIICVYHPTKDTKADVLGRKFTTKCTAKWIRVGRLKMCIYTLMCWIKPLFLYDQGL